MSSLAVIRKINALYQVSPHFLLALYRCSTSAPAGLYSASQIWYFKTTFVSQTGFKTTFHWLRPALSFPVLQKVVSTQHIEVVHHIKETKMMWAVIGQKRQESCCKFGSQTVQSKEGMQPYSEMFRPPIEQDFKLSECHLNQDWIEGIW